MDRRSAPGGTGGGCEGPEGWCLLALALLTSCSSLKPSARAFKHTQSIFSDSPAPPGAPPPLPGRRAVTSRAARRLAAPSCHPSLHSTGPPPSSLLGTGAGAQTPGPGLHSCLTESEQPEESRRAGPRHVHSRAPFYRLQALFHKSHPLYQALKPLFCKTSPQTLNASSSFLSCGRATPG